MKNNQENFILFNKKTVSDIFNKKKKFHRRQAQLPIEEKIKQLVMLQKIALKIRPKNSKEDNRMVWKID